MNKKTASSGGAHKQGFGSLKKKSPESDCFRGFQLTKQV
jgi:hypothetical protein